MSYSNLLAVTKTGDDLFTTLAAALHHLFS